MGKHERPSHDDDPSVAAVDGALFGIVGHNAKWKKLGSEDSPLVRGALIKADELRRALVDPGDAYLEGLADFQAVISQLGVARAVEAEIQQIDATGVEPQAQDIED